MTEDRLNFFRQATTWGGWILTFGGVVYNLSKSDDRIGPLIALSGVFISGFGHLVGIGLARRQRESRKASEARIVALEDSLEEARSTVNNPHLKRILDDAAFDDYLRNEID